MESDPKRAGWVAIAAALLAPSWWVLPQVLAGLGLLGVLSAGCLLWLERLQPVFLALALGSIAYQVALVRRRPPFLRTWGIKTILGLSVAVTLLVIGSWVALWFRYR